MGCFLFLVVILQMHSCEIQGLQSVFVQHGKDLQLDVKKPVVLDIKTDFFWKFNITKYVGKINHNSAAVLFGTHERRAELFGQNYSLILKNVQHSDSGDYTAVVTGAQEQRVAEYKVIVQDPVSPADLTVTSRISDSCYITVTCSTVDLNISSTFRCDAQNCSQVEEKSLNTTKYSSSLIVYLQQDTIFCNHSNQVSWKQRKKVIKSSCETTTEANNTIVIVSTIVVVALAIVLVAVIVCHQRKKGMYNREIRENTVYAVPEVERAPCMEQNGDSDASVTSPTSTYCLVGSRAGPKGSAEPKDKALPESLYAQIESHPRSSGS